MQNLSTSESKQEISSEGKNFSLFAYCAIGFQIVLLIFFACFTTYGYNDYGSSAVYTTLVGLGLSMTSIKRLSYSALAFSLFFLCIASQLYIFVEAFFNNIYYSITVDGFKWSKIRMNGYSFNGEFAFAMILSFGVVLGRTSPMQQFVMIVLETIIFGFQRMFTTFVIKTVDLGGAVTIHAFGTYFGLACSLFVSSEDNKSNSKQSNKSSDLLSLLGTVLLWIYLPSFYNDRIDYSYIQSVLALVGSAITTFALTILLRKKQKFGMADIQGATLAGAIAIGSCSGLLVWPAGSIGIGIIGAGVYFASSIFVQPLLEKFNIYDTFGFHNIYGLPAIVASIIAAIVLVAGRDEHTFTTDYGDEYTYNVLEKFYKRLPKGKQAGFEVLGLLFTLFVAIAGGCLTGFIIKKLKKSDESSFDDDSLWEKEQ